MLSQKIESFGLDSVKKV